MATFPSPHTRTSSPIIQIIQPAAAIAWKTGPRLQTDKVLWLHFPGLDPACSPDTQTAIQISSSSSSRV